MNRSNYNLFRIYGYPGFGLLLYLILILLNQYDKTFNHWRFYVVLDFVLEYAFCTAFAVVLVETGIQLGRFLNKWCPWETRMKSRFAIQLSLHIIIIYLVINLFAEYQFPAHFGYDDLLLRQTVIVGIIFSLLVTAVFAAEYFFYSYKDAKLRSLELEQYSMQAQLEALKLQLDPHFLFNNLSILTALIEDKPSTAVLYVSKLSSIYRYMLTNRLHNMITLKEELDFISAYLFLYEIRYGDGIRLKIEDSPNATSYYLPPLTLQLLIENAIKHNFFSTELPLTIHIYFTGNKAMVVRNNKQPKAVVEAGTEIGLRNIKERLFLMSQQYPVITDEQGYFMVEVPLTENYNYN